MPWLHVAARGSIDIRVLACRQAVQPAGGVRLPVNTSLWVRAGKVVERVGRHLAAWHGRGSVEARRHSRVSVTERNLGCKKGPSNDKFWRK